MPCHSPRRSPVPLSVAWFAISLFRATAGHWKSFAIAPLPSWPLTSREPDTSALVGRLAGGPPTTARIVSAVRIARLACPVVTQLEGFFALVGIARRRRKSGGAFVSALASTGGLALRVYLMPIRSTIWNSPDLSAFVAWAPWVEAGLSHGFEGLSDHIKNPALAFLGLASRRFRVRLIRHERSCRREVKMKGTAIVRRNIGCWCGPVMQAWVRSGDMVQRSPGTSFTHEGCLGCERPQRNRRRSTVPRRQARTGVQAPQAGPRVVRA